MKSLKNFGKESKEPNFGLIYTVEMSNFWEIIWQLFVRMAVALKLGSIKSLTSLNWNQKLEDLLKLINTNMY